VFQLGSLIFDILANFCLKVSLRLSRSQILSSASLVGGTALASHADKIVALLWSFHFLFGAGSRRQHLGQQLLLLELLEREALLIPGFVEVVELSENVFPALDYFHYAEICL